MATLISKNFGKTHSVFGNPRQNMGDRKRRRNINYITTLLQKMTKMTTTAIIIHNPKKMEERKENTNFLPPEAGNFLHFFCFMPQPNIIVFSGVVRLLCGWQAHAKKKAESVCYNGCQGCIFFYVTQLFSS